MAGVQEFSWFTDCHGVVGNSRQELWYPSFVDSLKTTGLFSISFHIHILLYQCWGAEVLLSTCGGVEMLSKGACAIST